MRLAALLSAKSQTDYEGALDMARAELSAIFASDAWGVDTMLSPYTHANYQNLWENELSGQVRRRLEEQGKGPDDYATWLGSIHFASVAVYWKPLFGDAYRRNVGWRLLLLGIPAASSIVVGIASHYQQAQKHNQLGRVSNLLYDQAARALEQRAFDGGLPGRKVSPEDWDADGLIPEAIHSVCGIDISDIRGGRGLFLKDLRTSTVKKIIASLVTLQPVNDGAVELPDLLGRLRDVAEALVQHVYPFSDLRQFEAFRALALQDLSAASQQLLLRRKPSTRTVVRVYYGPPGTGKTLMAVKAAVELADPAFDHQADFSRCFDRFNQLHGQVAFITFHQALQYEDVVEAIRPVLANTAVEEDLPEPTDEVAEVADSAGDSIGATPMAESGEAGRLVYYLHSGPLMRMIRQASVRPDLEHVLVIDEINRGDISRILGPLISVIEPDKRAGADFPIGFESQYPRAPDLESRVFLPPNLHILGTMNSADRNIALVDYALRRRFEFVEVSPQEELVGVTDDDPAIDMRRMLQALNGRIRYLLDRDHCIGHGYFMQCKKNLDVIEVFARRILPLLREYFYGNEANVLLAVGDRIGQPHNVHRIERVEAEFEHLFKLTVEEAVDVGHRPSQAEVAVSVDPRFWNPNRLIPGPDEESYAVKAIQKIYEEPGAKN